MLKKFLLAVAAIGCFASPSLPSFAHRGAATGGSHAGAAGIQAATPAWIPRFLPPPLGGNTAARAFNVSISGTQYLGGCKTECYQAVVSGGSGNYTYEWTVYNYHTGLTTIPDVGPSKCITSTEWYDTGVRITLTVRSGSDTQTAYSDVYIYACYE